MDSTRNGQQADSGRAFYPRYTLACGCRVILSDPITLEYCRSHSLVYDCAQAFKAAAPAAYQRWLSEATKGPGQ